MATTTTPTPARPTGVGAVLREIGSTIVGALAVVLEALRLLLAHWPVLVVTLLLGATARELVLFGSFQLSRVSPVGATITVALAPLVSVIALVVALRVVMPSMGHVPDAAGVPRSRRLVVVGSALVPFLAVYAAQGYLTKDTRRFLNEVYADEFLRTDFLANETIQDRTWAGAPLVVSIAIVVMALVLRWGLDRYALTEKHWGFGFLAGWVEALWLVTIAKSISTGWSSIWAWVQERRGVHWLVEGYEWVIAALGPLGGGLSSVVTWLLGLLGSFDTLIVVPMAWLTVGAVVYGRELGAPAPAPAFDDVQRRVLESIEDQEAREQLERARERARLVRERAQAVGERVSVVPEWLRSWVTGPITSLTGRFSALGKGLLTLVRAGLVPMITLCLVLVAGRHLGTLVGDLLRWLVGPMETAWAIVISPTFDVILTLVNTLVMVVLIAAAVDRFLARPAEEEQAAAEAAAGAAGAAEASPAD